MVIKPAIFRLYHHVPVNLSPPGITMQANMEHWVWKHTPSTSFIREQEQTIV